MIHLFGKNGIVEEKMGKLKIMLEFEEKLNQE